MGKEVNGMGGDRLMDYLSATRIARDNVCKCGRLLSYRINSEGEYEVFCSSGDKEHQGWIPQPTNRDAWEPSFKRQERIMEGDRK